MPPASDMSRWFSSPIKSKLLLPVFNCPSTKLGDVEESAERESKKLLQSYIPSETESRYKTLMGGSPVEGELAEAEYLAIQFGGQRQLGRDVSDIYGTYEEDVFGRLSDFISNLG